jgi:hypothetical protein
MTCVCTALVHAPSVGAAGATEIAFQPVGDIERELHAFAAAAGLG